jgi:DNA-binding IclR family transcriptional regulator
LLAALAREGMVVRDATGDSYRLGPEAIALGARAARANDLRTVSRADLEALAAQTGETVTLEVPVGTDMLILDEVLGRSLIGATASLGTRWPAYATSTGKAVLAALPDAERPRHAGRLARYTPRTIVSPLALHAELAAAARLRHRVEELGAATAMGAALRGGQPAGRAISVGGPRRDSRRAAGVARSGGPRRRDRISRRLGAAGGVVTCCTEAGSTFRSPGSMLRPRIHRPTVHSHRKLLVCCIGGAVSGWEM